MDKNNHKGWIKESYIPGLVSVIIPSYNRTLLLSEAIQSVVDQAYRPIECIVVDDGSTDNTSEIVEDFIGNNNDSFTVKYIYQENQGSQVARNTGTVASQGEFIQYLDSDDLLYPDKLKSQVEYLIQNAEIDGVYGDWEKGNLKEKNLNKACESDDMVLQLLTEKAVHTLSFLFRRSRVRQIGEWDKDVKRNQEIDFQVRGLLSGASYKYVEQTCGLWRIHDGARIINTTGSREIIRFYKLWEHRLTSFDLLNQKIKNGISNTLFWAATSNRKTRDDEMINLLTECIRFNPSIHFYNSPKMKLLSTLLGKRTALKLWWRWFKHNVR